MKIGYVYSFRAYPPKGGGHRHAYELTQGFLQHGHEVCVLDDPTMPGATNYTRGQLDEFLNDIDVLYVRIDGMPLRQRGHVLELLTRSTDIPTVWEINAPADERLAFSWLGGKRTERESVLVRARRWLHAARQKPGINREVRLLKALAARVDAAICLSNPLRDYARDVLGIDHVAVIPMAGPLIDEDYIERKKSERRPGRFRVLYSGRADLPWLGLRYLREAIELARSQSIEDIDFRFIVPNTSEMLPSGPSVSILEGLSLDELIDETIKADVGVALYPEYTWVKRGLHNSPTKIFEYMACRCPVITSDHGQMTEVVRDGYNGFLVDNDPQHLLQTILRCKRDPDRLEEMGKRAWETVQARYNWPRVVDETLEVLSGVPTSSSASPGSTPGRPSNHDRSA